MHAKCLVTGIPTLFAGGTAPCRAGEAEMTNAKNAGPRTIKVTSDSFGEGTPIPVRHAQEGDNLPPVVSWSALPPGTESVVLMVEDPDAPLPAPFVHWILYDLSPTVTRVGDMLGARDGVEGRNSKLKVGYVGCAPPRGDGAHHYHFEVFALDTKLGLKPGAGRTEVVKAMEGHVLAQGDLVGTYQRPE